MEQAGRGRNVSPNRTKQEYIIYRIGHMMSSIIIHQTLRVCGQRERERPDNVFYDPHALATVVVVLDDDNERQRYKKGKI